MRARYEHATPGGAGMAPAGTTRPEHNSCRASRARSSVKQRSAMVFAIALLLSLAGIVVPFGKPQATAEAKDIPPTMLILDASGSMMARDASGSMMARDAGGQTRLDAAKEASKKFLPLRFRGLRTGLHGLRHQGWQLPGGAGGRL